MFKPVELVNICLKSGKCGDALHLVEGGEGCLSSQKEYHPTLIKHNHSPSHSPIPLHNILYPPHLCSAMFIPAKNLIQVFPHRLNVSGCRPSSNIAHLHKVVKAIYRREKVRPNTSALFSYVISSTLYPPQSVGGWVDGQSFGLE